LFGAIPLDFDPGEKSPPYSISAFSILLKRTHMINLIKEYAMAPTQPENSKSDFPNLAQPAQRALAGAGYSRLEQLTQVTEPEIKQLHGIGPNALKKLRTALEARGWSFALEK
jgi:hypothetical protein